MFLNMIRVMILHIIGVVLLHIFDIKIDKSNLTTTYRKE